MTKYVVTCRTSENRYHSIEAKTLRGAKMAAARMYDKQATIEIGIDRESYADTVAVRSNGKWHNV